MNVMLKRFIHWTTISVFWGSLFFVGLSFARTRTVSTPNQCYNGNLQTIQKNWNNYINNQNTIKRACHTKYANVATARLRWSTVSTFNNGNFYRRLTLLDNTGAPAAIGRPTNPAEWQCQAKPNSYYVTPYTGGSSGHFCNQARQAYRRCYSLSTNRDNRPAGPCYRNWDYQYGGRAAIQYCQLSLSRNTQRYPIRNDR